MAAAELVSELDMDPNDCLVVEVMRRMGVTEICSFDKGFDGISGIKRLLHLKVLDIS